MSAKIQIKNDLVYNFVFFIFTLTISANPN